MILNIRLGVAICAPVSRAHWLVGVTRTEVSVGLRVMAG